MEVHGKAVNIFLMDGKSDGRVKCTLANWTGTVYRIPRESLLLCTERDDLKQRGIFFLLDRTDEAYERVAFIGKADHDGVLNKIQKLNTSMEAKCWSEALVIITSGMSFGVTELEYLEHRFIKMASKANRYMVKSDNTLGSISLAEEKESELEEYIEYVKLVIEVLGHKIFKHLDTSANKAAEYTTNKSVSNGSSKEPVIFYIKRRGANARAIQREDGFVLLKGSVLCKEPSPSCPECALKNRVKYKHYIDDNMALTNDIIFRTPSGASCFVLLGSSNGNLEWLTNRGKEYGKVMNT